MAALVIAINVIGRNATVRGLMVTVDYKGNDTLISQQTIEKNLLTVMPMLTTQKVKEIDTRAIREHVERSPYVEHCQSYVSILGHVVVKARQRSPLLHVYYGGKEFYIDRQGHYVPRSKEGTAHVMVANGHFRQPDTVVADTIFLPLMEKDSTTMHHDLTRIWRVAHFIDQEDYTPLFDQIYINQEGDVMLTPKLGTHVVCVGDDENLPSKFEHLMALYKQALPRVGWDRYTLVDLKFKDQIVCRKKDERK